MKEKTSAAYFTVVTWPDIQYYMDLDGFEENSYLINDEKGIEEFGSSAYFIDSSWLEEHGDEVHHKLQKIYDDMLADSQIEENKNTQLLDFGKM